MNWVKSGKCFDGNCVEVGTSHSEGETLVGVRNSQIPGETVWFTPDEWQVFLDGVRAGEFDL